MLKRALDGGSDRGGAEKDEEVKKQAQGTIWREGEGVGDRRRVKRCECVCAHRKKGVRR
jgi:hypothetical protein